MLGRDTLHEHRVKRTSQNVLGGECPVVHQQKLDIVDVADKEGLVTGRGHMAGLLVGSKTNLWFTRKRVSKYWPPCIRVATVVHGSSSKSALSNCFLSNYDIFGNAFSVTRTEVQETVKDMNVPMAKPADPEISGGRGCQYPSASSSWSQRA